MKSHLVYPLTDSALTTYEVLSLKAGRIPGWCIVCGRVTRFDNVGPNFRETIFCCQCHSTNRHRQMAWLLLNLPCSKAPSARSLDAWARQSTTRLYNTEAAGILHRRLCGMKRYVCSEYLGADLTSGSVVNNTRHEDLMRSSFENERFDIVLSSDVLEHVPDPYLAHQEIFRILARGGWHLFTVPFDQGRWNDDRRAELLTDGTVRHLKEPIYHDDPVRPAEGALVYTIFSMNMLVRLEKIGFRASLYRLYDPLLGILGRNAVVCAVQKPA